MSIELIAGSFIVFVLLLLFIIWKQHKRIDELERELRTKVLLLEDAEEQRNAIKEKLAEVHVSNSKKTN